MKYISTAISLLLAFNNSKAAGVRISRAQFSPENSFADAMRDDLLVQTDSSYHRSPRKANHHKSKNRKHPEPLVAIKQPEPLVVTNPQPIVIRENFVRAAPRPVEPLMPIYRPQLAQ